ncbi:MAG: peroxide stress protein YaaA [bacterium]
MIILLSPAKNLNFDELSHPIEMSKPALSKDIQELSQTTRQLSRSDLIQLMGISDKLADLNFQRFQAFKPMARRVGKPAAFAFNGEVYSGLDTATMSQEDLQFAQNHLRILSGLYGLLRPLDRLQPYRLEMGTRLKTARGHSLYDFWGDKIAKEINAALKDDDNKAVLNLASNEYFKAVDKKTLNANIITPAFKDEKDGKLRSLMFFAKRARGAMARWAINHHIADVEQMKKCTVMGYKYNLALSTDSDWIYTRRQPAPKTP